MDTNFLNSREINIVKEMAELSDRADKDCSCEDNSCDSCKASIAFNEILCEILRRGKPGSILVGPVGKR